MKGGDCKVSKTASKVKQYFKDGATDLIIVGHGSEAGDEKYAGKVIGGGMLTTPQKDAGELATGIIRQLGAESKKVQKLWLWICHSSQNGVGVVTKNALKDENIEVYATPEAIGGIFYFLNNAGHEDVGQDSFVQM